MKKHCQHNIQAVMEYGVKTICWVTEIVGADDIVQMVKRLKTAISNPFSTTKE